MMTLDEVLIQIKNRGIEMRADGDELQCRPKEALTSELRSAMRTHKLELQPGSETNPSLDRVFLFSELDRNRKCHDPKGRRRLR